MWPKQYKLDFIFKFYKHENEKSIQYFFDCQTYLNWNG